MGSWPGRGALVVFSDDAQLALATMTGNMPDCVIASLTVAV